MHSGIEHHSAENFLRELKKWLEKGHEKDVALRECLNEYHLNGTERQDYTNLARKFLKIFDDTEMEPEKVKLNIYEHLKVTVGEEELAKELEDISAERDKNIN